VNEEQWKEFSYKTKLMKEFPKVLFQQILKERIFIINIHHEHWCVVCVSKGVQFSS
jgi:hypothetical protein